MSIPTTATVSPSATTPAIPDTLGSRLRRSRENAGIARERAALHVGRTAGAIRDWELNHRTPRYLTIVQLANLYGVPVTELIGA
jgi:transcriptional regulator with XRE-family HTH domain